MVIEQEMNNMGLMCWIKGHRWRAYICFPYRGWYIHNLICNKCGKKTWWHLEKRDKPLYDEGNIEEYLRSVYEQEICKVCDAVVHPEFYPRKERPHDSTNLCVRCYIYLASPSVPKMKIGD